MAEKSRSDKMDDRKIRHERLSILAAQVLCVHLYKKNLRHESRIH